jgi:hypothetical protein
MGSRGTALECVFGVMCVLCLLMESVSGQDVVPIGSGVVFERTQDVVITDKTWALVINFDLEEVRQEYVKLVDAFSELRGKVGSAHGASMGRGYKIALSRMEVEYSRVKEELETLVDLVEKKRVRRGWIDAGGSLLKMVLGTADAEDLRQLNGRIEKLEREGGDARTAIGAQLLILKGMEGRVANNTRFLRSLVDECLDYRNKSQFRFNQSEANYRELREMVMTEDALRQVGHALVNARIDLTGLRIALESSVYSRLSSILITPNKYLKCLRQIRDSLRPPLRMLAPCEHETLYVYYEIARVAVVVVGETLRVIIKIPLVGEGSILELYRVHTFPIKYPGLEVYGQWKVGEYLLIAKDRTYFAVAGMDELRKCREGPIYTCPGNFLLLSGAGISCEYDLFMDRGTKRCIREEMHLTMPFFRKVERGWVFTAPSTLPATFLCHDGIGEARPRVLRLEGSGLLTNVSHCDITGDNFKMIAAWQGRSEVSQNLMEFVSPQLEMFGEEKEILGNMDVSSLSLLKKEIDAEVAKGPMRVGLGDLIERVRGNSSPGNIYHITIPAGLGALLIVVLGLIHWKFTWIKGKCRGLGRQPTRTRTIDARNVRVVINQEKDDGVDEGGDSEI